MIFLPEIDFLKVSFVLIIFLKNICLSYYVCVLSHVQLFVTPWTVALQALLSIEFSRQEHWSSLTFPTPGNLPHPGMEAASLASSALAAGFFTSAATWKA